MDFNLWLTSEKNYSDRAARDVQSRLKRALAFANHKIVSEETLPALEKNQEFRALSMSVKSQLRRAIRLYREYNSQ